MENTHKLTYIIQSKMGWGLCLNFQQIPTNGTVRVMPYIHICQMHIQTILWTEIHLMLTGMHTGVSGLMVSWQKEIKL
ncbi:hypothetical protein WH06_08545 [Aeromonas salmonicida subsp. salmonicida]|nr:hypothetical protein WH06_08545 [Aeromonas salmonicida subsp. salmonicida]